MGENRPNVIGVVWNSTALDGYLDLKRALLCGPGVLPTTAVDGAVLRSTRARSCAAPALQRVCREEGGTDTGFPDDGGRAKFQLPAC